jgi:site-specific recombinase XerD
MDDQLPLFSTPEPEAASQPGAEHKAAAGLSAGSSLAAAILAWRHHLEQERSPENTVKAFVGDLNLAAQFVGAYKNIGQIATRDLDNWLQWQRTHKKCSPKTYARRVTSLKSFFRWLNQSGALPTDPAAALIQQSVLSPLPDILSEAEIDAALAGARSIWQAPNPNPTPYVLFTLLLKTGIKKGECLGLQPNHVDVSDPAAPVLWVRHPDVRHRYKERKLQLDASWLPAYQAYLEYRAQYVERLRQGKKPAARADGLFPWSPRRLEYWLQDVSQAAQLKKQISFDMCRWTCAVRDTRAGLDETHLRQKLGLSKIQWREISMKLQKLTKPGL